MVFRRACKPAQHVYKQTVAFVDDFLFLFSYAGLNFPGPESSEGVVVQCKGRRENIPAPVEFVPAQPIAAKCPLRGEHRRYLPSEVFLGRPSHRMIRKPVRATDGGQDDGASAAWSRAKLADVLGVIGRGGVESRLSQGVQRARLCYGFTQHSLGLKAI